MSENDSADELMRKALGLESPTGVERPLVMKFGGSLVEQLGAQLYPSVTATVAELISNAWDADAKNVWIQVPFEADWSQVDAEIVVLDDGHGMTRAAAQATYLVVGRKKRLGPYGDLSEGGRPVHGRKGIGKLAAFGTASYLECTSLRDSEVTAFGLDYDELRRLNPDQNYFVDPVAQPAPLVTPDGASLTSGTRVRLSGLRVKRKISEDSFLTSMSRRFALNEMNVWINGRPLERFAIPLEYRLPLDYNPERLAIDADGWATELLPSGDQVSWWIGFTAKPLAESEQQGISILARDKMAQRPFKFEHAQGTTAQLGLEYLVGEVKADWIDSGDDIDTDYIQSNRDQLQLENARLDEFLEWGRRRLAWSLRARQDLRTRSAHEAVESDERISALLKNINPPERRALTAVARRLAKIPEVDPDQLADVMKAVVATREDARMRELSNDIQETRTVEDEGFWALIDRAMRIDSQRLVSVLEARVAALKNLQSAIVRTTSVQLLASRVSANPWILDPRWSSLGSPGDPRRFVSNPPQEFTVFEETFNSTVDAIAVVWPRAVTTSNRDIDLFQDLVSKIADRVGGLPVTAVLLATDFDSPITAGRTRTNNVAQSYLTWRESLAESLARHTEWLERAQSRNSGKA